MRTEGTKAIRNQFAKYIQLLREGNGSRREVRWSKRSCVADILAFFRVLPRSHPANSQRWQRQAGSARSAIACPAVWQKVRVDQRHHQRWWHQRIDQNPHQEADHERGVQVPKRGAVRSLHRCSCKIDRPLDRSLRLTDQQGSRLSASERSPRVPRSSTSLRRAASTRSSTVTSLDRLSIL